MEVALPLDYGKMPQAQQEWIVSMKPLTYVPFGDDLQGVPHIMVDSAKGPGTIISLSHWPGNGTPVELKADTSTEIVAKFVRHLAFRAALDSACAVSVSNDHYDIDGLLSVWGVLSPEALLERERFYVDAAFTGDFDCFTTEDAAKYCIALTQIEERGLQGVVAQSHWPTDQVTAFIYRGLLGHVEPLARQLVSYEHLWREELRRVEASRSRLAADSALLLEKPEIDLAIVFDDSLHPYAVHEATRCARILIVPGNRAYRLYYRYESFVDFTSRPIAPRVRFDDLVKLLTALEGASGRWFAEDVATAHPCLQLYRGAEPRASSSIPVTKMVDLVTSYLAEKQSDPQAVWRGSVDWYNNNPILPPSLR